MSMRPTLGLAEWGVPGASMIRGDCEVPPGVCEKAQNQNQESVEQHLDME